MLYKVSFPTKSLEKKFEKAASRIPKQIREKILDKMQALALNPKPEGSGSFKRLNPPVEVFPLSAYYRLRIGHYCLLYDVDDNKGIVWILDLRKRDESTYK